MSEEEAVEVLHAASQGKARAVIDTTVWLKDVTDAVSKVQSNHRQRAVTRIAQARIVATAIHLRQDLEPDRNRLLNRWENVTFRIYGMFRKDARSSVGEYVRLAWRITNENLSADRILDELSYIGSDFPVDKAVSMLRKNDWYTGWGDELRYFFHRYEEHLAAKDGQNFDNEQWERIWATASARSIEHIRPQSRSDDERVHWLGNLMLLPPGLNSRLQDKPVTEKTEDYISTGLLAAREVAGLVSDLNIRADWTYQAMEKRERDLVSWALREWADQ